MALTFSDPSPPHLHFTQAKMKPSYPVVLYQFKHYIIFKVFLDSHFILLFDSVVEKVHRYLLNSAKSAKLCPSFFRWALLGHFLADWPEIWFDCVDILSRSRLEAFDSARDALSNDRRGIQLLICSVGKCGSCLQ